MSWCRRGGAGASAYSGQRAPIVVDHPPGDGMDGIPCVAMLDRLGRICSDEAQILSPPAQDKFPPPVDEYI